MSGAVQEIGMPAEACALSTLSRLDYTDSFLAESRSGGDLTGEQWARVVLEDASDRTRKALSSGWFSLGLKLGPTDSEQHVLGWEVRRSTPDFALLGAGSRLGITAELLFKRQQGGLFFATLMRHDNSAARLIWAPIAAPHRRIVSGLLGQAVARAEVR
jgi:hypothetical protein